MAQSAAPSSRTMNDPRLTESDAQRRAEQCQRRVLLPRPDQCEQDRERRPPAGEAILTIVERRRCAGNSDVPGTARYRKQRRAGHGEVSGHGEGPAALSRCRGLRIRGCGVRKFAATSGERDWGDGAEPCRSALQEGLGLGVGLRGAERGEVGRVGLGGLGRRAVPAAW